MMQHLVVEIVEYFKTYFAIYWYDQYDDLWMFSGYLSKSIKVFVEYCSCTTSIHKLNDIHRCLRLLCLVYVPFPFNFIHPVVSVFNLAFYFKQPNKMKEVWELISPWTFPKVIKCGHTNRRCWHTLMILT